MKYLLLFSLVLSVITASAQPVDSMAIKHVDSLIKISIDLISKRDFERALEVNAIAEKIALEELGRESASYGTCCFYRGGVLYTRRDYTEAEKWLLESKSIREKALGKEHPDYARSLISLANLYKGMGQFEKVEPLLLEAKAIREKALGRDHPDYAWSLNSLANLYGKISQYEKAEPLYLEAKDIQEKVFGRDHLNYSKILYNLAGLYFDMGQYEKAESLYMEAKAIQEKVLDKEHPSYAATLNNLAVLYKELGNYYNAELLYLEAKSIVEKSFGKEHLDYTISLNNLGDLYEDLGNYQKAEALYQEALTIREKVLGKDNPLYAISLNNLANLYVRLGQSEKVEPLYLEAKSILEKSLGKEHLDYTISLNNLGVFYEDLGNYEKAEPLYQEALAIREKVQGKDHPRYAISLNYLANLYRSMGQYEKAEPFYMEAKAIQEKVLGKEHPDYAAILGNLAGLYGRQTRFLEAESLLAEVLSHSQARMVNATTFLSEQELAKYTLTFQSFGNELIAYIMARQAIKAQHGNLPNLAYDHALFYKGFLLIAASRLNSPKLSLPESAEMYLQLKAYRRRLAEEYAKPITERKYVAELEEKANSVEKELTRTVAGYADAIQQVKWQEVQKALKEDEAVVEFVNFQINFPQPSDSVMYAALLITSESPQPFFIPLFEEKELTKKISSKSESQNNELIAQIYTRGLVPLGHGNNQVGLFDLCWKPLDSLLVGIKKIYYSPAGMLNQINFDAISAGFDARDEEITLADKYALVRIGSTRSVVIPDATAINTSNEIVLYGGIQFELDTTLNTFIDSSYNENSSYSSGFELALRSASNRGSDWNYLPGTEREIAEIKRISERVQYPAIVYQGSIATEETVKALGKEKPSPRILHFATHGFFFPDPEVKKQGFRLDGAEPVFKMSDNPMIRSGLILAGGNYAWQNGKPVSPEKEDGILTAYEISQMNLANTELVVLSACETGLGDIKGNEGVYGLQRAFKIAGAKYLIMSLWQVPDRETMEFMTTFYKNWLEGKMTIPDAFRKTQREMRDRFYNPYSWAGFVLVE